VRVVASIEARMGSTRLPGKVLLDVAGRPALEWVVRRLQQASRLDDIVIATTVSPEDDVLAEWATGLGVAVHRGGEDDVLQRVIDAQTEMGSDVVVEVTGDSTVLDPEVIDLGVQTFLENDCDVVSTVWKRSYPRGIGVQVFPLASLIHVGATVVDPAVREHVSLYFYEHPELYRIVHLFAPRRHTRPDLRLSLDYPEDHQLLTAIYERLLPIHGEQFGAEEIIALFLAEPDLAEINRDCEQKPIR
jgi:spore coat polysaccharide biosynthesis protein SpsF